MTEIKSALTPEEWAHLGTEAEGVGPAKYSVQINDDELMIGMAVTSGFHPFAVFPEIPPSMRPAVAALALHGQPFGFTWDDVDMIRGELRQNWRGPNGEDHTQFPQSLGDRIAALLPPRGMSE